MSIAIPILAVLGGVLALAVVAPVSRKIRLNLVRGAAAAGWLGVLGGAVGIYTGQLSGLDALVGTAGCAGLAVLPVGMRLGAARDLAAGIGGIVPLVAGILGLLVGTDINGQPSGALLLYAGHWGSLGAAVVSALIAAGLASSEGWRADGGADDSPRRTPGLSIGVAIAALCGGAYLIGAMRGGPEGVAWSIPLVSGGTDVTWQIPPAASLPNGLWLDVVADLGWMAPLLVVGGLAALATGVATRFDAGKRASTIGWLVSAAASLAGVVGLLDARASASLPTADAYRNTAATLLTDVENAKTLIQQGKFVTEGDVHVAIASIAPELAMMLTATVLAGVAAIFAIRKSWPGAAAEGVERTSMALYARDYAVRAVILGWLSWLLVTLIHWSHFGAVGLGSPAEWSAVGTLAAASGLLLVGWPRGKSSLEGIAREAMPGLVFALLVVAVAIGIVFGAPFGLSIVF